MIKREFYKDVKYFDEFIAYNERMLPKFIEKAKNKNTPTKHKTRLYFTIFRKRFILLISKYSRGYAISDIKSDFIEIIDALDDYLQQEGNEGFGFNYFDSYIRALWLISISYLIDIPKNEINRLTTLINQDNKDAVYDTLVSFVLPKNKIVETLLYPAPYKHLVQVKNSQNEFDKFLKTYYKGMKKAFWYEAALDENGEFFGYWSFEAAAFIKHYKFEYPDIKENMFIPKDMIK